MKQIMLAIACLVFAAGCAPSSKILRVSGEDAAISGFVIPAKEVFEEENRGITLDIVHGKPGSELFDLEQGKVDAIVSVQTLADLVNAAVGEKVAINPAELRVIEVGKNDTVFFLNRKNSIKKLTKKQLKSIFAGKITNWKQLHGANRAIVVVLNSAAAAENEMFLRDILGQEEFAAKQLTTGSFEEVRNLVMETPGAIGVAPSGYIVAGVNVPKAPRTSSPVIVITKGAPSAHVSHLTDILKDMALLQ
jgi:phosphate transport system substrate-binding protein